MDLTEIPETELRAELERRESVRGKMPRYRVKLKTRMEIERTVPPGIWGWWKDVCPGGNLILRDSTAEDIARCCLNEDSSRDPADYLCETFARGALVHRAAVKTITTLGA